MVLCKLEKRTNGGCKPLNVKHTILDSLKEGVILVCRITFKTKRMQTGVI